MLKKNFNYFTMFATGLFFCVLGFSFIFDSLAVWNWLYTTLVIGISVAGVIRIFNMILNYRKLKHKGGQFLDIIVWLIAIIISLAIPETFFAIFRLLDSAACHYQNHRLLYQNQGSAADSVYEGDFSMRRFDHSLFSDCKSGRT